MIVHILRFAFKDQTTDEQKAEVLAALDSIASAEPVLFKTIGQDLGNPADGFTHAYCVAVEDLAALERYMYTEPHLEGDFVILPRLAKVVAFDVSDDFDPEMHQKIAAMHRRKVEAHPEWAELLRAIPDVRGATEV